MTAYAHCVFLIPDHKPPSSSIPYNITSTGKMPPQRGASGPLWANCASVRGFLPQVEGKEAKCESSLYLLVTFLLAFMDGCKMHAGNCKQHPRFAPYFVLLGNEWMELYVEFLPCGEGEGGGSAAPRYSTGFKQPHGQNVR